MTWLSREDPYMELSDLTKDNGWYARSLRPPSRSGAVLALAEPERRATQYAFREFPRSRYCSNWPRTAWL
jgi:hypothetical protein